MRRGEITGQIFDVSKTDVGMPFRSMITAKRGERKNRSTMDDIINVDVVEQSTTREPNFEYFDPSMTSYSKETCEDSNPINVISNYKNPMMMRPIKDRFTDGDIQNIAAYNTDYINTLSLGIYNDIAKNTYVNFCVFPIGILATLIANDPNIKKVLSIINTTEIFHQIRSDSSQNQIVSRTSVITDISSQSVTNTFLCYEDNDNNIIEFPLQNKNFAIGFLCNKHGENMILTNKIFSVYVSNLKHTKMNIYCPSFSISNKLKLNKTLSSLGYTPNNNFSYVQTLLLKLNNNIFVKTAHNQQPVDLSELFMFYIRYIPNNIILYLGRHGF